MSGIAGIVRFDGAPIAPEIIRGMTSSMSHRGLDGIQHWCADGIALGQCMTNTTPESLEERQPLASDDASLVLVMDGRVDNWIELRSALLRRGARLRDRSDAELVLKAFQTWGEACVEHIDGDFAFAIWNNANRSLFCARDRIGIRPFNYFTDGTTLLFASEVQAILRVPGVRRSPNDGMLADFLANSWTSLSETFWEDVSRLAPAHRMMVERGRLVGSCYWHPELACPLKYRRDLDYVDHYRELLDDTVRRLSRSHAPLAFEVSGGLDSSALFAVAERLRRDGALLAPSIEGYTLRFEGGGAADELVYARAVASHVGASVHEIEPTYPPLAWFDARAARSGEFPGYPNGTMGLGIRRAAAQRGCRSLVVGVGGDEWLCGRRTHYMQDFLSFRWRELGAALAAEISKGGVGGALGRELLRGAARLIPRRARQVLRPIRRRWSQWSRGAPELLAAEVRQLADARKSAALRAHSRAGLSLEHQYLLASLQDPFGHTARFSEENLAAECGIELRLPFHTAAIVQLAFSLPDRLRKREGVDKYLHRQALRADLPSLVLDRTGKAEFSAAFRHYLPDLPLVLRRDFQRVRMMGVTETGLNTLLSLTVADTVGETGLEWELWSVFGCRAIYGTTILL